MCEKIVKKNKDHYCLPARETDLIILADKLWWNTIHSGLQTLSDLIEEWYLKFQDKYKMLIQQEAQHYKYINKDHSH